MLARCLRWFFEYFAGWQPMRNQRQSALSTPLLSQQDEDELEDEEDADEMEEEEERRTSWTKLETQMAAAQGRDCG